MVQWLGLSALTAEGLGSIPGWGTKMPQAVQPKKKKERNKNKEIPICREYPSLWRQVLLKMNTGPCNNLLSFFYGYWRVNIKKGTGVA